MFMKISCWSGGGSEGLWEEGVFRRIYCLDSCRGRHYVLENQLFGQWFY